MHLGAHLQRASVLLADPLVRRNRLPAYLQPASLTEICGASRSDTSAAIGFALAWALAQSPKLIVWAQAAHLEADYGAFHAEGLAQFGAALDRILFVRAARETDALWATEQALATPGVLALCAFAPSPKACHLTATRRLLLTAEKHRSRCALVCLGDVGPSAAQARFSVRASPSPAHRRELGAPAFDICLIRNRTGPTGQKWRLIWDAQNHAFLSSDVTRHQRPMDGALAPVFADGSTASPERRRTV